MFRAFVYMQYIFVMDIFVSLFSGPKYSMWPQRREQGKLLMCIFFITADLRLI